MECAVKEKKVIKPFGDRTVIQIPARQYKRLLRSGKCHTVQNYQWYEIVREPDASEIELFNKDGKKISLSILKKMLRKVK